MNYVEELKAQHRAELARLNNRLLVVTAELLRLKTELSGLRATHGDRRDGKATRDHETLATGFGR